MLLNQNTYNRHRKKKQENEAKEENLKTSHQEESFELRVEDEHQQKDLWIQTEDMQIEYINKRDQEELDLVDIIDDTESLNIIIDEGDNEDYSDYNEEEDDDDEDDDDEDDDVENEDIDEDVMQIDDKPSKKIIEGLKLLHLKTLYNFTESAYDNINENIYNK